ncbi:MAG TPA: type II toxin-antitoxin system VapC family toxin [Solirubrobacterales bacterium]|nr:type II toxin-antitoxin system VapC family toxin [Solirubrobacterales bacterium]
MPLFYADSSALVKLVRRETQTDALRDFLRGADLISSELVLAEVPRAMQRIAAADPRFSLMPALGRANELIELLALYPVDRSLLRGAGALAEPSLRTLDAIHVASAVELGPVDAFVTYDERQAAAARLAGLKTMSPGV